MNDLKSLESHTWTAYMPKKMINLVKSFKDDQPYNLKGKQPTFSQKRFSQQTENSADR